MPQAPHKPIRLALSMTLACCAVSLFVGCQRGAKLDAGLPAYPENTLQVETLNIQVFRDGTRLELTNTTSRSLQEGTLWLNRWWAHPTPAIAPGESLTLPLREFEDKFGERFRAGGFFATRNPDIVVLAQLETQGEMLGLVIVENRLD